MRTASPGVQPWGIRDVMIVDPPAVLWLNGQEAEKETEGEYASYEAIALTGSK